MSSIRRLGNSVRVIVEHPDGGLLSIPASETSLELTPPSPVIKGQTPLFDPKKLLQLSQWVEKKSSAAPEVSFCQPQKLGRKKIDDQTPPTQESPSHRSRRAQETLDRSDSAVDFQNARLRTDQPTQGESS